MRVSRVFAAACDQLEEYVPARNYVHAPVPLLNKEQVTGPIDLKKNSVNWKLYKYLATFKNDKNMSTWMLFEKSVSQPSCRRMLEIPTSEAISFPVDTHTHTHT